MATEALRASLQTGPALRRLEEFAALQPNWDSYGAVPPSAIAIATARRLIRKVASAFGASAADSVQPYAVAPIDGGVQISWRALRDEVEIDIGPDGQIGYLHIVDRDAERLFEEADDASWERVLAIVAQVLGLPNKG